MKLNEEAFLQRLLEMFKIEADEHLKAISAGLLELEKGAEQTAIIETIFREAHSLKGAARSVNLTDVGAVCQALESVFSALKRAAIGLTPPLFDLLHDTLDKIERLITAPTTVEPVQITELIAALTRAESGEFGAVAPPPESVTPTLAPVEPEPSPPPPAEVAVEPGPPPELVTPPPPEAAVEPGPPPEPATPTPPLPEPVELPKPAAPKTTPPPPPEKPAVSDTIRISTAKLDTLLLQVEEMLSAKLTTGQRASDLRTVTHEFNLWRKAWTKIYPETQKVRRWLDRENHHQEHTQFGALLNFLEWNYTRLDALAGRLGELTLAAEQDQRTVGGMVDNLLEDMKTALMMPFASMLEIFPKMARDLARTQGKQVDLILRGSEVEIDRRILEEMKDPLIHLIRNAIDHGLEPPTERAPKPERGTILLTISQLEGSKIEILLEDDGAGINLDALKATAVRQGVLSKQEAAALDEREAIALIFRSAISTSPIITDISGRGLGMAIVQEKVEKLGGTIAVTTRHGAGTTFRILLPVTMAVFRGVLVRAAGRVFVIPTLSVKRVVRVKPQQIKTVQNEQTIVLNDYTLSIVPLDQLLELPPLNGNENGPTHKSDFMSVVVLQGAGREIAFIVDEVLNEQEVLVKGLGKQLSRVRNVAGATILGSGQVIPILNVSDLIKSAVNFKRAPARTLTAPEETAAVKSILVVEDSITSRTLLKNVLEVAGYQVKTCVDGVDAWTTLRSEPFDLMVSDVEMPRMNGFDLVAQVRADQKLAHLPVVLVTSLSSKEDRERGVDVGADAYIVKSSFDQTSLLETIRRLI